MIDLNDLFMNQTKLSSSLHWYEKQISLIHDPDQLKKKCFIRNQTSSLLPNKEKVSVPIFVIALNFFVFSECVLQKKERNLGLDKDE